MMIDEVLVPLDFGPQADRALPVARALAAQLGAGLAAVVVTGARLDPARDDDEARRRARRRACPLDRVVLRTDPDVVDGVLAAARADTTLLCLATRAPGPLADLVSPSVGEQVLARAAHPVVAVGPGAAATPDGVDEIVACVADDDPRLLDPLLDAAVAWSNATGAVPHLIRVVTPGDRPTALAAREALDAAARRLWARGVPATSALVVDETTTAGIVRTLGRRPGALAILASRGHTGLRLVRLGRVTLDVVRRSPVPVLVVPAAPVAATAAVGDALGAGQSRSGSQS